MESSAIGYYCQDQYWEAATAVAAQQWNIVAYTRAEVWSERQYDYEQLPRERVPPRSHPSYGHHRVANIVPKRPPLLDKRPPLLNKRPPMLDRTPPVLAKTPPLLNKTSPILDKTLPILDKKLPMPDKRPHVPDRPPHVLNKRPHVPDKRPHVPDKRPHVPIKRPRMPDKRPRMPDKRPRMPDKRPLLTRPDESYNRYYSHVDSRSFSHDRRSGPSHRGEESGYRWARDDHSTSWKPDSRITRDGFRRKRFYSSHYSRGRSPHERDAPFRGSTAGWKDSPHSRYDSNISNRSYSLKRSKTHSFHQSQNRSKKRYNQSLKTSKHTSPSNSSAVSSSKVLDKPSSLPEKEHEKAESKRANKTLENSSKSDVAEISQFKAESVAPLFTGQTEEPQSNTTDGTKMYKDNQLSRRCEAITSKVKEIQQIYRQDCETIGMVVKMLIEKDPSLEKSIQFALRQNLHEMGERCIEEVKRFIAEYDNSIQDLGDPLKK